MLQHIHRIVPLHWAITSFYVLLAAAPLMQSGAFEPAHGTTSSLFLPWPHPAIDANQPLVTPGQTLTYGMFFYLVFALGLFLPERRARLATVALLGELLGGLVAAGPAFASQSAPLQVYTSTMLLEFLFGMGVAVLAARRRQPRRWPA